MFGRRGNLLLCAVALIGSAPIAVPAGERLIRRFDHRHGLPVSAVFALGQDADGFLWIGTPAGLVRYDGLEMRLWTDRGGVVRRIMTGPAGEVLYTVSDDSLLRRVTANGSEPLGEARDAAFDRDGALWVARDDSVVRDDLEIELPNGERPYRLLADEAAGVLAATRSGVWRLRPGAPPRRLLELPGIIDLARHSDGSLFLLSYDLESRWLLLQWSDGRLIEHVRSRERGIGLALRGDAVWASFAGDLVVWRPATGLEAFGKDDAFGGTGGTLLVDDEGSLWMGNFLGLFQFPEPDTTVWTERDGLVSRHTRFVVHTPMGIWVSTWAGLDVLETAAPGFSVRHVSPTGRNPLCLDGQGRVWTHVVIDEGTPHRRSGILEGRADASKIHEYEVGAGGVCAPARDGGVWLSLGDSLLKTGAHGGRPRHEAALPVVGEVARALLDTRDGELWAGTLAGRLCRRVAADWACETLPGEPQVKGLAQTASGAVWAATSEGLFRRGSSGWETVPGSRRLPSSYFSWIGPSPAGGLWIAGHGFVVRAAERLESPDGWEVRERIGVWQGLPTSGAEGLHEEADGTLWVATSAGLVRIPPTARSREPEAPRVRLVDVRVDDERLSPEAEVELPHDRNRLEIAFAALSYRDPGRLRYRVRSRPDAEWSELRLPSFRFVDLPPGDYRPEVAASLDGVRWSTEPASLAFRVLSPWYLRPWAVALWIALAAAMLYAVYRTRVAVMLRLERQRARIAMDLHDELGSGLGSIRILADLGREGRDDHVVASERAGLFEQIADTSSELAGSLSDIVWSLRRDSGSIEALASQLAERGGRMFPDDEVELATEFPAPWPDVPLGLAVRRNLQRIGVEALHNVARHAGARRVVLGFAPDGARWRMWVEDDGRGLGDEAGAGDRGLGLTSMRTRADEIGASINWLEPTGGGTRIEVVFDPAARTP